MHPLIPFGLLALLLFGAHPRAAADTLRGPLPQDLGYYSIDLPPGWQPGGRLIVYSHGFDMRSPDPARPPSTAPSSEWRQRFLAEGYALAAGSFGDRGWALFDIEPAQRALLRRFRELAGEPGEILLLGGSLGGLVSLKTAEAYAADGVEVAGVLALCPPLAGARTWDQALDVRLLVDAVCPSDPLPSGPDPALPWVLGLSEIPEGIDDIDSPDVLLRLGSAANRLRQCAGLFLPELLVSPGQRARRARLMQLLSITDEAFLRTQIGYAVYPLSDLVQNPRKLDGRSGFDNRFVDYGDPEINARVLRVQRDPLAAVKLGAASDLTGRWGGARVLAVHTDRDELVFTEHLSALAGLEGRAARTPVTAVIREQAPAHCRFSESEIEASLGALRDWIDGGQVPDARQLQARCEALPGGERCGFDPDYALAPLESRTRPRALQGLDLTNPMHSGSWYDPATDGEGLLVEVLPGGLDAVVSWYTYPDPGSSDSQQWLIGLGRVSADGVHVAEARRARGARFGAGFDPDAVEYADWGEITLAFESCGLAPGEPGRTQLRWQRRDGDVGLRSLRQLSHHGREPAHCGAPSIAPPPHPDSAYGGSWYRGPEAPGEGLQLQVQGDGSALLVWYTFDSEGRPSWLIGTSPGRSADGVLRFELLRPRGTRFGAGFSREEVQRPRWGSAELAFEGCDRATLRWQPVEPGWPAGQLALQQLTRIDGSASCPGRE